MRVRQLEPAFHLKMAGEANLGIPVRIDNRVARAAGLRVQAAGPVTAFAADVLGIGAVRHQAGMRGAREVFVHFRVAFRAAFRSYKFRAGNIWRNDDCSIHCDT